jgi:anti-sigma B factor antagonist
VEFSNREGVSFMPLVIQSKQLHPDIMVLEMTGKITMGNDCRQVEWTTQKLVAADKKKIIFDLTGVTHIDSTGIGIIVMVAGQMKKAGGGLRVAAANQHIEQLLKMTNVDQIVGLHPTTEAAAAGF